MSDFGNKTAKDAPSPMVSAFYKALTTERGLKPNSIANVHVPLTQVFDFGVDSRTLCYNPCHGVMRRIASAYRRKRTGLPLSQKALRIEQEELFLDFLKSTEKNRRWYSAFAFTSSRWRRAATCFCRTSAAIGCAIRSRRGW